MTNLNKSIRAEIIDSVILKGTTLTKQKDNLIKRTQERVREICLTRVPKEFAAAVKNLPANWFPHQAATDVRSRINPIALVKYDDAEINQGYRTSVSFESIKHPMGVRFDRQSNARECNDKVDNPESWEVLLAPLIKEAMEIRTTEANLREQLTDFLASVNTYKQVLEKMPELEDHLPNHVKAYPIAVPVTPILKALDKVGFDQTKPKKKDKAAVAVAP